VVIQVPDELAQHIGIALLRYIRAVERDGLVAPPELARLAGELMRDGAVTAARRRELSAARSRRWRQRQRERAAS